MGFRINMKGVDAEFKKISKAYESKITAGRILASKALVQDLKATTPVDTGRARDSWELDISGDKTTVFNSVDYIQKLNLGSSQQAPAHFVESAALKYGKPVGAIVDVIQE